VLIQTNFTNVPEKNGKKTLAWNQWFFFPILWCCHTCYHPQEDLAKFGYKSDREVNLFQNPATVCRQAAVNCCLNLSTFITIGLRFWRKLYNFFQFALCTCAKRLLKFATSAKFGTKRKPLHGIFKQNNDWIQWNIELAVLQLSTFTKYVRPNIKKDA
jgi:hypothetical protein